MRKGWAMLWAMAGSLVVLPAMSQTFSRTDVIKYHDDTAKWVLGQVQSSTNSNTGLVESNVEFDPATAKPWRVYSFGKLRHTLTYNADGTLKTFTDGNSNTTTPSDWKRGIPQAIQYPSTPESPGGAVASAVVNGAGWIMSVTDENGYRTCYAYDAMGRLASTSYPSETKAGTCDISAWNATAQVFEPIGAAEYGIPAGHWRQTISTGNGRQETYYDALWQPLLVREYDAGDVAATQRFTVFGYDHEGRKTFASYPLGSLASIAGATKGVRTRYDAMGRVDRVTQNSEYDATLGPLTTSTEYLPGAQVRVTNPRQQPTTSSYQVYDKPSYEWPTQIAHPEGTYTDIVRDVWGKPTAITRRNADGSIALTRTLTYDSYQQLCRTIEPETGATLMGYDGAGNLAWSASGLPASQPCEANGTSLPVANRKAARAYDARNRLTSLSFPDLDGNQAWTYTPDGLPEQIITRNEGGTVSVVNAYSYNTRRLVSGEAIVQPGWPTWSFGYGYDANGHLAVNAYPGGVVDYAPNALGQVKKAGPYAGNVSYYPNGAMHQFTYGNGIVHTLEQNERGLPERSLDDSAGTAVVDDQYDYDTNGNVAAISDGVVGSRGNRNMTYDGLDRLKTVNSPMFGAAAYGYDVLDNIAQLTVTGGTSPRNQAYCYDGSWRLTNVKDVDCGGATRVGLGYDVQGNLNNKNGKTYRFDYGNRLREADSNTSGTETYRYDGHGRRVLSAHTSLGGIASMYGLNGALLAQRNERDGKNYSYVMLNGSLVAKLSTSTAEVPPAAPVPTVSRYSTGSYTVSWAGVATAKTYRLEERRSGSGWRLVHFAAETSKSFTGKTNGDYEYRAQSCNASGCGSYSAVIMTTVMLPPSAPPALTVPETGLNGAYTVSWGTASDAASYVLEENLHSGAWYVVYSGSGTSLALTGKPAGIYGYRVKACNAVGCSEPSPTGTVRVVWAPTAFPELAVPVYSTTGTYTIRWMYVAGGVKYKLEESANGGAWQTVYFDAGTSKLIEGKSAGTYTYRVSGCNDAGCGPAMSGSVREIDPPTGSPVLSGPGVNTTGSYTVSWSAVADTTGYKVEETSSGGTWVQVQDSAATSLPRSGKNPSLPYYYRARACNEAGCGGYSTTLAVQPIVYGAEFVGQSVPAIVAGGRQFGVTVQMRNTGNSTWTDADGFRLGSQNAHDNTTWGTSRIGLQGPVPPGGIATFTLTPWGPSEGWYNFQWRMVRDGVTWFGATTPNVSILSVTGLINANPNPCSLYIYESLCTANINWWSSQGGSEVLVTNIDNSYQQVFMPNTKSGSASAPWIPTSGKRFHLKYAGITLATVDVYAYQTGQYPPDPDPPPGGCVPNPPHFYCVEP